MPRRQSTRRRSTLSAAESRSSDEESAINVQNLSINSPSIKASKFETRSSRTRQSLSRTVLSRQSSRHFSTSTTTANTSPDQSIGQDEDDESVSGSNSKPPSRSQSRRASTRRSSTANGKRKRTAGGEGHDTSDKDDEAESPDPLADFVPSLAPDRNSKRRQLTRSVYVELPKLPAKSRASSNKSSNPVTPAKGKGKAVPTPSTRSSRVSGSKMQKSVASSEVELISDEEELEYHEESDLNHDSDEYMSEGSEYEGSDASGPESSDAEDDDIPLKTRAVKKSQVSISDDENDLYEVVAENDDEEANMLRAAIQQSLKMGSKASVAGPSGSSKVASSSRKPRTRARKKAGSESDSMEDVIIDDVSEDVSMDSDEGGGFVVESKTKARQTVKGGKRQKKPRGQKDEDSSLRALVKAEKAKLGRNLTWAEKSTLMLRQHHPELKDVWGDLERKVKVVNPERAQQPPTLKVTLLGFQLESLYWMRKQEEESVWHGGCLADEMGMGKTIQTLALFVSDRRKPNLIVAPTVAIMQWRNEIEAHTEGFKVNIFHGASRENSAAQLSKFDVVLTTYAVLESVFRKQQNGFKRKGVIVKEKSILHDIDWARVVLDEAHNIKERSTNTAKATFELRSKFRWCLSGTPLQNRVGELYSLVRFLGGDPFSYYFCKKCPCKSLHWAFSDKRSCDQCGHSPMNHTCFWNNEILTPIQKHGMVGAGELAFKKLKILLDRMMLRRTKIERADDLGLPPRTVTVRRDYFSPEEKELYLSLFSDAKRQFSTYVDAGTLLNNYSNIFSLITRMRQMACHPDLVLKSRKNANLIGEILEAAVCRLCNDVGEDAIQSKCHHVFDRECIKQYLNTAVEQVPECPVCHVPLSIDLEQPALEQDEEVVSKARQGILGRLDFEGWRSSTKIEALVEELSNLRRDDRTTKSIVFSQFVNFLDLIAWRLQKAGFIVCRLEGGMSPQARDATIKHFMNNVEVTVFLVSLKAGGVALNLVEASRVYLMDSWWNPAVEFQAMDRIHRLGQHRPVQAIKLVVEDSIESRIVQLQEKKSAMVDATLSTDDSAMGRLTPEDLGFLFRL